MYSPITFSHEVGREGVVGMWGGEGSEWKVEWLGILHLDIIYFGIKTAWSLYTGKLAMRKMLAGRSCLCAGGGVADVHTRLGLRPLLATKFMRVCARINKA